jgi:hypothetical protein
VSIALAAEKSTLSKAAGAVTMGIDVLGLNRLSGGVS